MSTYARLPDHIIEEITPTGLPHKLGDKNEEVAKIQEHLTLQGHSTIVDGVFGPATRGAIRSFQSEGDYLYEEGAVGLETWERLTKPFKGAFTLGCTPPNPEAPTNFGEALRRTIKKHLEPHPREVGGPNEGPWVRGYMQGKDGSHLPWCSGFVSTILQQASDWFGIEAPLSYEWGVDQLMNSAEKRGRVVGAKEVQELLSSSARCPFIFCVPGGGKENGSTDWIHTGFVTDVSDHIVTVEGNTNDSGDREGYEACRRFRAIDGLAFIDLRPNA